MADLELKTIICGINEVDRRLDRVVRKNFPSMPLSLIHKSIRTGRVRVNQDRTVLGYRLQKGDAITIPVSILPPTETRPFLPGKGLDSSMILVENDHLVFINKKAGVLVHGTNSLQHNVFSYLKIRPEEPTSFTPGPLHRLDRNTSGVICFGKTAPGARYFTEQLKRGTIGKFYLALVEGEVTESAQWKDTLVRYSEQRVTRISGSGEGKEALLEMHPLLHKRGKSLLFIRLNTGMTHQIRVQCASRGYPLTGDRKYGDPVAKHGEGYFLHAYTLHFEKTEEFIPAPTITAPLSQPQLKLITTHFGANAADSLVEKTGPLLQS